MSESPTFAQVRIGVVGVGTIASAVVRGICRSGHARPANSIIVGPRNATKAASLKADFPEIISVATSNQEVVDNADWVIVALLTAQYTGIMEPLTFRADQTVVSLMAGVSVASLTPLVAPATSIVLACPIPPVQYNSGLSILTPPGTPVTAMFQALGNAVEAKDEAQMQVMMPVFCMMGAHYQTQVAVGRWLVEKGIDANSAATLASGMYRACDVDASKAVERANAGLEHSGMHALEELVAEQTPGGLNEKNIKAMTQDGVFASVTHAMESTLSYLQRGKSKPESKEDAKEPAQQGPQTPQKNRAQRSDSLSKVAINYPESPTKLASMHIN